MSRAAHAASPAILPHVNPPVYGYLPAAHVASPIHFPYINKTSYGYLHATHAAIHALLPHVNPPAYGYLHTPFAPPSTRAPDSSVGQCHGPARCMEMQGSVETVLHMCKYYNVYHVFSRFFVNKHENIAFFSNFFLAKFGGLPGNLYLCTRFR